MHKLWKSVKRISLPVITLVCVCMLMSACSSSDVTGLLSRTEEALENAAGSEQVPDETEPDKEDISEDAQTDAGEGGSAADLSDEASFGEQEDAPAGDDAGNEDADGEAVKSGTGIDDLKEYTDADLAAVGAAQSGLYAYEQLGADQKTVYKQMVLALNNMDENVKLSSTDVDEVGVIFQCVMMDHPEIFWVNGYKYSKYSFGDEVEAIGFTGRNTMDAGERETRQAEIDAAAASILAQVPAGDDYTRIKFIYEYIIRNTEYDLNSSDNQNLYSVLVNGRSVCQGYSKATQYLLNKLGIVCTLITGHTSGGEAHAWNLVYSDGSYYYMDTTWGDASYQIVEGASSRTPSVTYDYLLVCDADIGRTHTAESPVPLPVCSAVTDNYYIREGAYFTSVDPAQLSNLFAVYSSEGREYVTVKCSDASVYASMKEYLLDQQNIFTYLPATDGQIVYFETQDQYSISFWL